MVLKEASYGGAYDIEDDMYFTKEDLLEFADELIDTLQDKGIFVDLVDMYMTDGNRLVIAVEDEDGNEIDTDEFIDMRKIRLPKDIYKYKNIFIKDILSQYNEFKSFNEDLDEIPVIDRLNFINKRRNGMPGIANINEFIDCLNNVGKDKFMVKETKAGSNLSLADLKDEWMTLKRKGWKWYTKNIPGDFLTYYVFEKINKGENMKENLVEDDLQQLKAEIENEVEKYMTSEGFEPDEVKEYSAVDVYFDSKERDRVIVEVRAELSYDGLFELGLRLDKIVANYDEDAYFEPEEPGITTAYIYNITPEKINKRSKQIKEDYEDDPNYLNDLYEILIQAQVCIDKIKENYSSDVYDIIKFGIEQNLDEFMEHDEDGWTMYAAIKESQKSKSIKESLQKGNSVTIWWKDPNWSTTSPSYASCTYLGRTNDGKYKFKSDTYGWIFIVDATTNTVTTPQGKEFELYDNSGWTRIFNESKSINESTCNYVDRYNNIVIYKCDDRYIATAINGKSVSGKSIDDVKSQLDKIDAEYTKHFRDLEEDKEDDDYYDDEDDENNNYPKNLPEQFYSLYDKLNGDFWTRKDELKQDIEEINDPEYSVEELNDEYVIVTDPEDDMHALQIFNGGTERTYVLDFDRIRYL